MAVRDLQMAEGAAAGVMHAMHAPAGSLAPPLAQDAAIGDAKAASLPDAGPDSRTARQEMMRIRVKDHDSHARESRIFRQKGLSRCIWGKALLAGFRAEPQQNAGVRGCDTP